MNKGIGLMDKPITTLEEFEAACKAHDLTYDYSDDGWVWSRGLDSESKIRSAAKKFSREDVERIWNAVVDTKLVTDARKQFYWRWPK